MLLQGRVGADQGKGSRRDRRSHPRLLPSRVVGGVVKGHVNHSLCVLSVPVTHGM